MKFSAGRAAGSHRARAAAGGARPATGLALGGAATVGTELLGGAAAGGDSDGANAASGPPASGPLLSMVAASGSTARFETGPPLFAGDAAGAGPDAAGGSWRGRRRRRRVDALPARAAEARAILHLGTAVWTVLHPPVPLRGPP